MVRIGRSATAAAESSGDALSTTVTLTHGSAARGLTQARSVSRLLYATITASTVTAAVVAAAGSPSRAVSLTTSVTRLATSVPPTSGGAAVFCSSGTTGEGRAGQKILARRCVHLLANDEQLRRPNAQLCAGFPVVPRAEPLGARVDGAQRRPPSRGPALGPGAVRAASRTTHPRMDG